MKYKIADYLEKDGIKYSMQGFRYLCDAIELAMEGGFDIRMGEINNEIARRYGAKATRVDRNMRYAIQEAGHDMNNKEYIAKAVFKLEQMNHGASQTI